jgi:hypothetical protein
VIGQERPACPGAFFAPALSKTAAILAAYMTLRDWYSLAWKRKADESSHA